MVGKREVKGVRLLEELGAAVAPTDNPNTYLVSSEKNPEKTYRVVWDGKRWTCSCKDYEKRKGTCKHVWAIRYYLVLKRLSQGLGRLENENICPYCGSNMNVVRRGWRYNRERPVQVYLCKSCKKYFSEQTAFLKMKTQAKAVVAALDLYFKGLSLRKTAEHLKEFYGVEVSHTTILKWIRKYSQLIGHYTKNLLELDKHGERFAADETIVKVKGRDMRLWTMLDEEKKLVLAYHISRERTAEEAEKLLLEGLKKSEEPIIELVTDGCKAYEKALEKIAKNGCEKKIVHIQGPLIGPVTNNKMERWNGKLKDRIKAMRGIKNKESLQKFLEGWIGIENSQKLNPNLKLIEIIQKDYIKNMLKEKTKKHQLQQQQIKPKYII